MGIGTDLGLHLRSNPYDHFRIFMKVSYRFQVKQCSDSIRLLGLQFQDVIQAKSGCRR